MRCHERHLSPIKSRWSGKIRGLEEGGAARGHLEHRSCTAGMEVRARGINMREPRHLGREGGVLSFRSA